MNLDVKIDYNELYRQTFHQALIGMSLTSEDGHFIEVNEMFCDMLGYSREELLSLTFQEVTHPEDLTKNLSLLSKLKSWEITTYQIEKRYICKDGRIIWAITNATRVKGSEWIIAQVKDITMEKQEEMELREKEENYRLMSEYSTDLIVRHYPNGKAFCVSPSSREILGFEPDELVGVSPYDPQYIHPDDLLSTINSHKEVLNKNGLTKVRYRMISKSGAYVWIESTAKAIFDQKTNQLQEIITVSRDCTDQVIYDRELKRAKAKLETSNQLINNIVDSITDGFFAVDYNGNIIFLNSKTEQIAKKKRQDLIGMSLWEQFPFLKGSEFEIKFFETIHKYVPTQFEMEYAKCDFWLEVRMYPRKGIVAVYFTDITQRKKMERELRESEERYRTIVESSNDAIGIHCNRKFVFVNSAFLQLVGATHYNEVIGKPANYFLQPSEKKCHDDKLKEFEKQEMIQKRLSTFTIKTIGDSIRDIEVTADKVLYNGQPAIQFIARDITERKKYEEFLNKVDKLNLVGELAAGVAHEIRNPLTTIKGFMQFFQSTRTYKDEYFQLINSEFERVESIIYEFLTLAKPHNEIHFKQENIIEILGDVIKLENTNALLKNVQLQYEFESSPLLTLCDKHSLKQVIINILQNALEATNEKGKIRINVQLKQDNFIEISCKDNGCGIPKHLIHRLGEPFYSLKEKGTGLGLMICFKIIENHNGTITIESEEGEGTTVIIRLPLLGRKGEGYGSI